MNEKNRSRESTPLRFSYTRLYSSLEATNTYMTTSYL